MYEVQQYEVLKYSTKEKKKRKEEKKEKTRKNLTTSSFSFLLYSCTAVLIFSFCSVRRGCTTGVYSEQPQGLVANSLAREHCEPQTTSAVVFAGITEDTMKSAHEIHVDLVRLLGSTERLVSAGEPSADGSWEHWPRFCQVRRSRGRNAAVFFL